MIEPMSVMCQIEKIDVPWAMIELIWKQYLKSAAYHSYAGVSIDSVSQKNRQRLTSAIRLGRNVLAMLSRIFAQRFIREEIDAYQKLILFNYDLKIYEGPYEIKINVKDNRQIGQFSFWDQDTPLKFSIIKTYPDLSYLILLHEVRIPAFNYKLIGVKYHEKPRALPPLENFVRNDYLEVKVGRRGLTLTKGNKTWTNFWQICAYPSAGDTFTHAPLKEVDRAYFFDEFKVLASDAHHQSLRVLASGFVPSGIENWTAGKEAQRQNVEINIVLIEERVFFQVNLTNALQDTRLVVLVDANSGEDRWWHDQVFGLEENQINPAGLDTLEKPDSFGYRRPEYLGNQSVHHHFVANYQNTATIFTQGTREHELLVWEGKHYFAFTLLRSFSKISAKKLA
ncbi:uncharacterized protein LOC111627158 [Centruroides sculpturatus]|uniref:uncharacterized protein LOC111627158 n=1 Tax=Centruroides sculpturatus TaxID=218467 RepID=UPI000C6DF458|nr:uncharacterized protein LOC111627158 [Centruroides sculpturatus]